MKIINNKGHLEQQFKQIIQDSGMNLATENDQKYLILTEQKSKKESAIKELNEARNAALNVLKRARTALDLMSSASSW